MTKTNVRMVVAYDGTDYLGWQKTKTGKSIEETLGSALQQILREEVALQAASRTDRGVHAQGQVVNFFSPTDDLTLIERGVNAVLPKSISVKSVEIAAPSFHPTLDATGKEYQYFLCPTAIQLPFHRNFSWHLQTPLEIEKMKRSAEQLVGKKDFSAFCNAGTHNKRTGICTLREISFTPIEDDRLKIAIIGDNFLYKMVRNLVGTLVYVGMGKIKNEELPSILEGRDRTRAGITAPAHGLVLQQVFY
ncbi:MAG: tRNA pseudouridine(38-40) synthase TruA [Chlamydiales bacterium]